MQDNGKSFDKKNLEKILYIIHNIIKVYKLDIHNGRTDQNSTKFNNTEMPANTKCIPIFYQYFISNKQNVNLSTLILFKILIILEWILNFI